MAEPRKPAVPLAAVVIGGLLAGAGLFGLFRGASAEPVNEPLPPVKLDEPRPDPFGTLPVPSVPVTAPPVAPAGGIVPAPLPPVPPVDVAPPTKPADTLPIPKVVDPPLPEAKPMDTLPVPRPLDPVTLPPLTEHKPVDALPLPKPVAPVPAKPADTLPPVPGIEPVVPKPTVLPQPPQPVKPGELPAPVPSAKPENVLRPEPPPLTVNPVPTPVGPETLPPPRKVGNEELPLPRPVVEQTSLPPIPTPGGGVPIATPTTPGLTPMPVSRTAVLSALIGAAVSAAPAFAEDPKTPATPDTKALEAIQKQIDDLKADVKLLTSEKKKLSEELYGRGDGKTAITETDKGLIKRYEELKAANEKANKEMADKIKELEGKLALKSVSEKQSLGGNTPITPGKGLVKLVNEYNTKVSMMVNGTSYPLEKNEVKEIQVPAGDLKYELVEFPNAIGKTTTIKEGETVTLRIK